MRGLILVPAALSLSGCIVGTAVDVVTLPVKAASKTVDVLTTSQSAGALTRTAYPARRSGWSKHGKRWWA